MSVQYKTSGRFLAMTIDLKYFWKFLNFFAVLGPANVTFVSPKNLFSYYLRAKCSLSYFDPN